MGNHKLFVGGDDHNFYFGVFSRDHDLFATGFIGSLIESDTKIGELFADAFAGLRLVLTNASGEDYDVNSSKNSCVCTYIFQQAVFKHVKCKFGAFVSFLNRFLNITHIVGYARNAGYSTLFVDEFQKPLGIEIESFHEINQCSWVYITHTGSHHESFSRGKTHGGVDRFAILYCCNRTSVADMAGYDALLVVRNAKEFTYSV